MRNPVGNVPRILLLSSLVLTVSVGANPRPRGPVSENEISQKLLETDRAHDAILPGFSSNFPFSQWKALSESLKQTRNLDLGFAYTTLGQVADHSIMGPRSAASGDLDFFGRWSLRPDDQRWPLALNFETEWRHRYTRVAPSDLKTGTLGGTIVDFDQQGPSITELYGELGSIEEHLVLALGKIDPSNHFDVARYGTPEDGFFSPAFSDTPSMALPESGLGILLTYYHSPSFYVQLGLQDANGSRNGGVSSFFDQGEYFTAFEVGWSPGYGSDCEGHYHATFWHSDDREEAKKDGDWGFSLLMEQEFGKEGKFVPFLRYAWAERGLNEVKESVALGIGIEGIRDHQDDVIGVAGSWMKPVNRQQRDQYVVELFYRIFVTPHLHISPDIQFIFNPSKAPNQSMITVAGLRLRSVF